MPGGGLHELKHLHALMTRKPSTQILHQTPDTRRPQSLSGNQAHVQGDLIPWTVGQQMQDPDFPSLSGARIVRIAVHPDLPRAGYGSRAVELLRRCMLQACVHRLLTSSCLACSASCCALTSLSAKILCAQCALVFKVAWPVSTASTCGALLSRADGLPLSYLR